MACDDDDDDCSQGYVTNQLLNVTCPYLNSNIEFNTVT